MTSREQFEEALLQVLRENHPTENVQMGEIVAHRRGEGYESSLFAMAWWAWQASREAVVVVLPETEYFGDSWSGGWAITKDDVTDAIEAAGIRVAP